MGPTKAYINHTNLAHNFNLIKNNVAPARVMAVVKADGYGHGSIEASRTLVKHGVEYLGVAFHEEGIELRENGINTPILVFGAQLADFFEAHLKFDLDITLGSLHQIEPLRKICMKLNKRACVHIKIDTGMNRVGFFAEDLSKALNAIFNEDRIEVVGIYSHLSGSDEENPDFTRKQIRDFLRIKRLITKTYSKNLLYHIANSGAIMRYPEAYFDMVRPGVMLYGNPPSPDFKQNWDIREVMRFTSKITAIKSLPAGEPVSYSRRFYTKSRTRIGIVPAGYADGYNRKLTNTGQVLIGGKRYPVVGTVCMDQFMVDLGPETDIKIGDEVTLFGRQENEHIKIIDVSRQLETIPYEVTCWVSKRVNRIHISE